MLRWPRVLSYKSEGAEMEPGPESSKALLGATLKKRQKFSKKVILKSLSAKEVLAVIHTNSKASHAR